MSAETTTHFMVPTDREARATCLGPDGSVAHVTRVIRMIQGRWKLPILFRLYADPTLRTLQLKRDLPGISQKMLTQHLRELADDQLIDRVEHAGTIRRVEYKLSEKGRQLLPVLTAARSFSVEHPSSGRP